MSKARLRLADGLAPDEDASTRIEPARQPFESLGPVRILAARRWQRATRGELAERFTKNLEVAVPGLEGRGAFRLNEKAARRSDARPWARRYAGTIG
jgi:hypothetical protein